LEDGRIVLQLHELSGFNMKLEYNISG